MIEDLLGGAGTAVTFEPGDRVLIATTRLLSAHDLDRMRQLLEQRFPGVFFTIAPAVSAIAVMKGS